MPAIQNPVCFSGFIVPELPVCACMYTLLLHVTSGWVVLQPLGYEVEGIVLEQGSDGGVERRGRREHVWELNQREVSLIAAAHLLMELMKNESKLNALRWKKFHYTAWAAALCPLRTVHADAKFGHKSSFCPFLGRHASLLCYTSTPPDANPIFFYPLCT